MRTTETIATAEAVPTFASTLTAEERRLAGRLEGFGDIVFGFAVSQCALQLPTVNGHVDLQRPLGLVFYFLTFALLASLWLTYHRLMSGAFRPSRIDVPLAFAYLAFVSLMPYAQYSVTHDIKTLANARAAIAEYSILFGTLMGISAIISFRNLRRGWWSSAEPERNRGWVSFTRRVVLCAMMFLACAADLLVGVGASNVVFLTIAVALGLVRALVRRAPSSRVLRIDAPA